MLIVHGACLTLDGAFHSASRTCLNKSGKGTTAGLQVLFGQMNLDAFLGTFACLVSASLLGYSFIHKLRKQLQGKESDSAFLCLFLFCTCESSPLPLNPQKGLGSVIPRHQKAPPPAAYVSYCPQSVWFWLGACPFPCMHAMFRPLPVCRGLFRAAGVCGRARPLFSLGKSLRLLQDLNESLGHGSLDCCCRHLLNQLLHLSLGLE